MSGHSTGTSRSTAQGGPTGPAAGPGRRPAGTKRAADSGSYVRPADRQDFERVVERVLARTGTDPRARTLAYRSAGRITASAGAEYGEYDRARREAEATRPGFSPARAWSGAAASAAAVLGLLVAADVPAATSAWAFLLVFTAVAATAYLASAGGRRRDRERAAEARERLDRCRRTWLSALERGVQEVVAQPHGKPGEAERQDSLPPASAKPDGAGGAGPGPEPVAETALSRSFAQLPLQDGVFVGRDHALSLISQWARDARESGQDAPCVVVLHGPPGAGRTALAVRAAKMMSKRYQGACLVNLRGRPGGKGGGPLAPVSTRDALLHLLNRLGAPQQDLLFRDPSAPEVVVRQLRQKYLEHTARLSTVLILDDAADAGQVRPLIPDRSPSLVLITSREPLDLGDAFAVHSLPVDPLTARETAALFAALAGPLPRPPKNDALIRASGGLPLAVRMAGAALAADPGLRLPSGEVSLETVMRLAYGALPHDARRLFRRLVLVGRASLGTAAAAALLDCSEEHAAAQLETLARAHMVEHVHSGRYRLPEMLRSFARARLEDEEDRQERIAAQERLIRDYAELAASVIHHVEGASSSRAVRTPLRGFDSLDEALSWLDEESSFITATLRHTDDVTPSVVQALVEALCDYCLLRGDLYRLGEIGELAQSLGRDPLIRAVKLRTGIAARQTGQLDRARSTLSSVVSLYREGDNDAAGAARALCSLGITLHHRGALAEAEAKLREAVALQQPEDQRADRAWTLHALGAVLRDRGRLAEAWELLHMALALHEEAESLHGQAWTCLQLGQVLLRLGQLEEAEEQLWLSQELYRRTRDGRGEAWALTQLGRARLQRGQAERAVRELNEARTRHRRHEDARGEAWSLYYLGMALEDAGRLDRAEDALSRARHMFSTMGDKYGYACARHHFARVSRDRLAGRSGSLKNSGFPRQLLHQARQDFRKVGLPHGEAWTCIELAVIDAGCGRIGRAAELLDDATAVFEELGDEYGRSWAVFLHSTLLPLILDDGLHRARQTLEELIAGPENGCHPTVRRHARTWLDGPWIGTGPESPWPVWQLGLTPTRKARDVMGISLQRGPGGAGMPVTGAPED